MTLLIIVAALLVSRFFKWPVSLRDFGWYAGYLRALRSRLALRGVTGLLLALALPLGIVLALQGLLDSGTALLLGLVFAWLVLLCCLGRHDLLAQLDDYLRGAGDGGPLAGDPASTPVEGGAALAGGVLARFHDEYLGLIFWFVLLGPAGAALYRAAAYLARDDADTAAAEIVPAASYLHGLLGWPSARLAALSFALVADFDRSIQALLAHAGWNGDPGAGNDALLRAGAAAALDLDADERPHTAAVRARVLALRTLGLWLLALAVLTLAGWLA